MHDVGIKILNVFLNRLECNFKGIKIICVVGTNFYISRYKIFPYLIITLLGFQELRYFVILNSAESCLFQRLYCTLFDMPMRILIGGR